MALPARAWPRGWRRWRRWRGAGSPPRPPGCSARRLPRSCLPGSQLLAGVLAEVAGRLEPAEAARVCAEPARVLSQALAQEKDANARQSLAAGLAAVAGRLEPA